MRTGIRRFLGIVGPGVITGAADDDPSGIATYSQAGAQFGYAQLWTVLPMLPMMIAVQEISARIGIVNGKGIAGVVKDHYPRVVLLIVVILILIANVINLGTDLGAMAAATQLLVPLPYLLLTAVFAVVTVMIQVFVPYRTYRAYLKWLSVSLFAYVLTGFIISGNWAEILRATFIPRISFSFQYLMILTGVLGTTISPYMFFWQASQEVEEEIEKGDVCPITEENPEECPPKPVVLETDIKTMEIDTWAGMIFSQIATWFIIVTAAGTLHRAGITDVNSAAEAARALEPLVRTFPHSGTIAKTIFAVGIIGLGLIAVPIFAGAASYALAETFGWTEGLGKRPQEAPCFYGVLILATIIGMMINFAGINPIKALVYTAVINGVVAVPLIYIILRIGNNPEIMGRYTSGFWTNLIGWITFAAMGIAAASMIVAWIR